MELGPNFARAFQLALELHGDQTRKGSGVSYMGHLLGVTAIVIDDGGSEDEAIAALLHDGPEDSGGLETLERIHREFGDEVHDIVKALSDTFDAVKPPWKARKEAYLGELRELEKSELNEKILRVSLADKLHNARAIAFDWESVGDDIWSRFSASKDETLWYHRTLGEIYRDKLGEVPLVMTYQRAEKALREL